VGSLRPLFFSFEREELRGTHENLPHLNRLSRPRSDPPPSSFVLICDVALPPTASPQSTLGFLVIWWERISVVSLVGSFLLV